MPAASSSLFARIIPLLCVILCGISPPPALGYVNVGRPERPKASLLGPKAAATTIERPWQVPADFTFVPQQSHVTAVAPRSSSLLSPGSNRTGAVYYAIGYRDLPGQGFDGRPVALARRHGVFKRGVFASDPPGSTCTPCGNPATTAAGPNSNSTSTTAPITCSTSLYGGVFRSPFGAGGVGSTTAYCFPPSYGGVFNATPTPSSTTLPCCFSIPSSCLPQSNLSTSYSGVFRPTAFASNMTFFSPTLTPVSSISPSATLASTTVSVVVVSSTTVTVTTGSITGSVVISNTTITVTTGSATGSVVSSSTISISRFPASSTLSSPNIQGGGTATCSGAIIGSGTVLVGGFFPVVSSGTVSGSGTATGCGTVSGTGTFSGSGVAVGCGTVSGTGTVIGSGTVYVGPGNLIPIVGSGTVSGSALVVGCGTMIGSGTYAGTGISSSTPAPSSSSPASITGGNSAQGNGTVTGYGTRSYRSTVTVYTVDCGPNAAGIIGLPSIANNGTDPVNKGPAGLRGPEHPPTSSNSTRAVPGCNICAKDTAICCPWTVSCQDDGHCPTTAVIRSGWFKAGKLIVSQHVAQ